MFNVSEIVGSSVWVGAHLRFLFQQKYVKIGIEQNVIKTQHWTGFAMEEQETMKRDRVGTKPQKTQDSKTQGEKNEKM